MNIEEAQKQIEEILMLNIFLVILIVGFLLWVVSTYVPMESGVKKILIGTVVILLVIYLLKAFHLWSYLQHL